MPWVTPVDQRLDQNHATTLEDHEGSALSNWDHDACNENELGDSHQSISGCRRQNSSFDHWLDRVGDKFRKLSAKERNQTLDHLIRMSEGPQLYHLSEQLNELLKRDFLSLLPEDVVVYLVQFLGAETMLACTLVCKRWRDVINSCNSAWKAAAITHGGNLGERLFNKTSTLKKMYHASCWYTNQLKANSSFITSVMYGHRDRVMTIYYHKGVIATGSDDHTVRLWNCETGICFRILHTHSTVATIQFDEERIVTASFNATATLWDLPTGEALKEYVGHVAAVFSIDYDAKLDILITGSADSTVKVWLLSSAVLLKTLTNHRSTWITHVCLYWDTEHNNYAILSRDDAVMHMWTLTNGHDVIANQEMFNSNEGSLLPGWQVEGPIVWYTTYSAPCSYRLLSLDLRNPTAPCSAVDFVLDERIPQGFLGTGSQFTLLLHAKDGEHSEMTILKNDSGNVLATIPMPRDYRPSKRGSTFTLGERAWLDGFTSDSDLGVLIVACLRDNGILQLRWRPQVTNHTTLDLYPP